MKIECLARLRSQQGDAISAERERETVYTQKSTGLTSLGLPLAKLAWVVLKTFLSVRRNDYFLFFAPQANHEQALQDVAKKSNKDRGEIEDQIADMKVRIAFINIQLIHQVQAV